MINITKKQYGERCMKLAKKIVHIRDQDVCQKCFRWVSGNDCHCSHVIADGKDTRLSVDPINMKILCLDCHINRRHRKPKEAMQWFQDSFPARYAYLMNKLQNKEIGSISIVRWENTHASLLQQYKDAKDTILK